MQRQSDVGNLQSDKADKTDLAVTNQNIVNLQNDKVDKTVFDVTKMMLDGKIINLQNDKVDKTQTIIGLDLQDNILIGEFKEKFRQRNTKRGWVY